VPSKTENHIKACELLRDLEKLIEEHKDEIPAADMGLFHIRRAMELIMCSPEKPIMEELEKKYLKRGIIIE